MAKTRKRPTRPKPHETREQREQRELQHALRRTLQTQRSITQLGRALAREYDRGDRALRVLLDRIVARIVDVEDRDAAAAPPPNVERELASAHE